ncbi:MAG: hypothetical protein M1587_11105 [Thaumarchaeota archaeon]|nr:hypothetical protein [Nitrososphaerota archaeon]
MSSNSVSELVLRATVPGRGEIIGNLHKHLSPVTIMKIQRAMPITGRVNLFEKNFAYILTNVATGEEKSRKEFRRGEITFMPAGSMICFFLQDTKSYKPMNLLGVISDGMEVLESCRRGDSIEIRSLS